MSSKNKRKSEPKGPAISTDASEVVQADGFPSATVEIPESAHGNVMASEFPKDWPASDFSPINPHPMAELGRKVREEREDLVLQAMASHGLVSQVVTEPKPREFTPRDCSQCVALRPRGVSYSRVYAKRGTVRYCKCGFCGFTWSQEGS